MVIGGRLDVGRLRNAGRVLEAIELLRGHPEPGPAIAIEGGRLGSTPAPQAPRSLWLMAFDRAHEVAIERGENRGRTLRYHNVVREVTPLGRWWRKAWSWPCRSSGSQPSGATARRCWSSAPPPARSCGEPIDLRSQHRHRHL